MNTEENPLFDVVIALGTALAVVIIVLEKNSGITLFVKWGVPIELTILMLIAFSRSWALMMHGHVNRGLTWAFVGAAALIVPAYTQLMI